MIKFLVMDVDGTLTDGKIYMGVDGECMKAFDIKDGYALHTLLKENGIIPVIITARKSPMVEHRCKELGVTEIHQGVMNKLDCLKSIIENYSSSDNQYDFSNVAYIGDDLLDLQCMNPIKEAGGMVACPSNAAKEVIAICDYTSQYRGGEGAVRDFVEYMITTNCEVLTNPSLEERCLEAANYLSQLHKDELTIGRHDINDDFYYNVLEYETSVDEKPYESHRQYVDIQMLLSGEELMQVIDVNKLLVSDPYDITKDCVLYNPTGRAASVILRPQSLMVLYPNDAHRSMAINGKTSKVLKIVGKLHIQ